MKIAVLFAVRTFAGTPENLKNTTIKKSMLSGKL
jgi:hypothetical protein